MVPEAEPTPACMGLIMGVEVGMADPGVIARGGITPGGAPMIYFQRRPNLEAAGGADMDKFGCGGAMEAVWSRFRRLAR